MPFSLSWSIHGPSAAILSSSVESVLLPFGDYLMLAGELISRLAGELSLSPRQVAGALELFEAGNTLPFIARYRKEATGGLDEVVLRDLRDFATYLRELEERRAQVLRSIEDQGKLDAALRARIECAET